MVMTGSDHIPGAVLWHEGMLLAPQHFQQADRRMESLLAYHLMAAAPYHRGVRHLDIDKSLLLEGVFRVNRLETVLPDGLLAVHPAPGSDALEIDLNALDPGPGAAPVAIHLAVAAAGRDGGDSGATARFRRSEGEEVLDENGDGVTEVPRLMPLLTLLATEGPRRPPPRRYVSVPLAVVGFEDDTFVLGPFVPPVLAVVPGSRLHDIVTDVAALVRARAISLADRLQGPMPEGAEFVAGVTWPAVRALVSALPRLEALLHAGNAHPFVVYLALCDTAGNVACLGGQPAPPQFEPYHHDDPLPAFTQIAAFIERVVDRLHEPYQAVRFTRETEGRFTLAIRDEWIAEEMLLGVRAAPGQPPAQAAAWLERSLIAAAPALDGIRQRRTLGLKRRSIDSVREFDLIPPRNVVLFGLALDRALVMAGERLVIEGSHAGPDRDVPAEIVLYVPREGRSARPPGPGFGEAR
ncbi:MAG: hypothetical protein EA405_10495 [Rhodospirillales bacterium]|nr:MAG: hypothetical protein EA405_10495 [Rhodospirillales bacterium]